MSGGVKGFQVFAYFSEFLSLAREVPCSALVRHRVQGSGCKVTFPIVVEISSPSRNV